MGSEILFILVVVDNIVTVVVVVIVVDVVDVVVLIVRRLAAVSEPLIAGSRDEGDPPQS